MPRSRFLSVTVALVLVNASLLVTTGCAQAQPADDAALLKRGQRLYLRCAACHDLAPSDIAKNGPPLQGVIGRRVAAVEGYAYSSSLAAGGFDWDEARLDQWLEKPTALAPGTTMAFEGMPSAADRQAVIAYLRAQRR